MKKFRIKTKASLAFLTLQDQVEVCFVPSDEVWLETDGKSVWACMRRESITTPNIVDVLLKNGDIEEDTP